MAERKWETVSEPVAETERQWETISAPAQDSGDFRWLEYLAQRFTNPTMSAGAGAAQPGSLTGFLPLNERAMQAQTELPSAPQAVERMRQDVGIQTQENAPFLARVLGGGAEAMGDPLSWASPGTYGVKAGTALLTGGGAEVGGEIGEQVAGTPGRIVGSLSAGTLVGSKAPAIGLAGKGLGNLAKQAWSKYKAVKADPTAVEDAFAAGGVKKFIEQASLNVGGADNFEEMLSAFNQASQYVRGKETPLLVSMAENPTVRAEVISQIKKDPATRAKFDAEINSVIADVDSKADQIFGARYTPFEESTQGFHPSVITQMEKYREQAFEMGKQLDKLADPFYQASSKTDIGTRIAYAVDSQKKAVKAELAPQYAALTKQAKRAGVKLPEQQVRDIYNHVVNNKLVNMFQKGSPIDTLIIKNFAPDVNGEFFPVSFSAVDSLKKRINELQRGKLTPTESRQLDLLEQVVDKAREKIPGNYNARLKALDEQYWKRLGMPFGEQGIKDIDSAKYAADIAPKLLKQPEALDDFLDVAGKFGVPIAENAVIASAFDKVIKSGEAGINGKALETFMRQHRAVLERLPNAKKMLQDALIDDSALRKAKAEIDIKAEAMSKKMGDNYLLVSGIPDYRTMVNGFLNNKQQRTKILSDLNDISPEMAKVARQNMQRELLEVLREKGGSGVDFLLNPRNKEAMDSLLGSGSQEAMQNLLTLSDAAARANLSQIPQQIVQSKLDAVGRYIPGLDVPYITSTLRDRISSGVHKVVRLATRWNDARAQNKFDEDMVKALISPEALEAAKRAKGFDFAIKNPYADVRVVRTLTDSLPASVYLSRVGMDSQEEE